MHQPRRRSLLWVVVVVALAASLPARAFSTFGRWASTSVLIYINPANLDVSLDAAEAAVIAAMDAWNTRGATPFRFLYGGRTTDSSVVQDSKNVVMFRNQNNGAVLASTYSWLINGVLIESDIVFWDGGWAFFTGTTGCVGGMYIEDVGTHELGHALGLGHSTNPQATMYASVTSLCSQHLRMLSPDDVAGVQSLYGASTNQPPSVTVTAPAAGATFTAPASIAIAAGASDADGVVTTVTFYANNAPIGADSTAPYGIIWNDVGAGSYTLTAVATDSGGATGTSTPVTVQVLPPPETTVSFAGRDTTTGGNWQGTYGRDGYLIVADGMSLPAGVAITAAGQLPWTWESEPSDERALQRAPALGRVAATWYGSVFTINLSTGATPRRVGLYAVDWDHSGRTERIDVLDAVTGALLDSRTVTAFAAGEHWVWNVTGAVRFRITQLDGPNAVVSGIFIDPAGVAVPTNLPPSVSVTSPPPGATYTAPASIALEATAGDADGTVAQVAFYANGSPIGTDVTEPFGLVWGNVGPGTYAIVAVATDNEGATRASAAVSVQVAPAPGTPSAVFVGQDTVTSGNWQGAYGRDGYVLVGDGVSVPAGVTIEPAGTLDWIWSLPTGDARALERTTAPGRIAATWYGHEFTFDVGAGAAERRVSLYVVDWDARERIERIDVLDAASGTLLDSRTLSAFAGGEYWSWQVGGTVRFRVTVLGGDNAVVSAVFLDPAGTLASASRSPR